MFKSLRARLLLTYALVIGVVLLIVGLALVVFLARQSPQASLQLRNALSNIATRQAQIPPNDWERLAEMAGRVDELSGVRIMAYDRQHNLLVDTRAESEAALVILRPPPGVNRGPVQNIRDEEGNLWLSAWQRLQNGLVVAAAVERQPVREVLSSPMLSDLLTPLLRAGGIALVLALVLAFWMSRWVAGPLQKMAAAAESVAEGGRAEVGLEGPEEVQALGAAFNEMTHRVHASQQSQRDFVANVSHELKTPLTSIQGFAQAMLDGTVDSEAALEKSAQIIYDEAGRMHRLVAALLDLAKLDAGTAEMERHPLDLEALLRRVGEQFTPQSQQAEVRLVVEIEKLPTVIGDGDRLAQVFTNLVDNALKHTPPSGEVRLAARQVGEHIETTVADTGPGIPPEELSRIFERFYQLDKSRPGGAGRGAGLGLTIAQEIVRAHGGRMQASSVQGEGSRFTVLLPVARHDDSTAVMRRVRPKG